MGEVAGKPIRKPQRFDLPGSCRFLNSLCGDGHRLADKGAEQLSWNEPFSNRLFFLQMSQVCKAAHRLSWSINKPYLPSLAPSPSAPGKVFSRIQTTREIAKAASAVGEGALRDVGGRVVHVWAGQDLGRGVLEYTGKLRPEMTAWVSCFLPLTQPHLQPFALPVSVVQTLSFPREALGILPQPSFRSLPKISLSQRDMLWPPTSYCRLLLPSSMLWSLFCCSTCHVLTYIVTNLFQLYVSFSRVGSMSTLFSGYNQVSRKCQVTADAQ